MGFVEDLQEYNEFCHRFTTNAPELFEEWRELVRKVAECSTHD